MLLGEVPAFLHLGWNMTAQHTEYIVPTTEGGEVERLRERADQASAEAERLRQIARTKQGPYYQVNKSWPPKYGPGVALLMAAIRDYTRLEYGVCFAERGRLAKELGATPDKIKHWSSKIRESGEFFFAIRPGRTTVYALSQEALRAFMEGEGRAKTGFGSGESAPGVGRKCPTIENKTKRPIQREPLTTTWLFRILSISLRKPFSNRKPSSQRTG